MFLCNCQIRLFLSTAWLLDSEGLAASCSGINFRVCFLRNPVSACVLVKTLHSRVLKTRCAYNQWHLLLVQTQRMCNQWKWTPQMSLMMFKLTGSSIADLSEASVRRNRMNYHLHFLHHSGISHVNKHILLSCCLYIPLYPTWYASRVGWFHPHSTLFLQSEHRMSKACPGLCWSIHHVTG